LLTNQHEGCLITYSHRITRYFLGSALVVVEHTAKKVPSLSLSFLPSQFFPQLIPASLCAITAATKLGPVTALVAGKGAKSAAHAAQHINGLSLVVEWEAMQCLCLQE
jgi:hypothetical protein